jgi:beta-xylosidase
MLTTPIPAADAMIRPGTLFHDQHGGPAQLHGVGVLRIGGRFFAWGEDKRRGQLFSAVACYSSTDLARWRFEGHSLSAHGGGDLGAERVVERPKVLYHAASQRYVMFLHIDSPDYADARVGVATSDTPAGPYTYVRGFRPLGNQSRDIGVFQDDDGAGYLLSEDRANGLHIYRLTPDYLDVAEIVATTLKPGAGHGYESPSVVKADGLYYLFGSDLTGWSMNDNMYATAASLAGPWAPWQNFAPLGTRTFESQTSVVVPIVGSEGTTYVYVGDRWLRDDLASSPAVWLPLDLAGGRATLRWETAWRVDPVTGRVYSAGADEAVVAG